MSLPANRPYNETLLTVQTSSIATSPVAACVVCPTAGYVQRVLAAAGGTTTGTIAVAVAINAGSDFTNSGLSIAAGSNARNNASYELALLGAGTTSGMYVNEGDVITFTPSGGTGSSIIGSFGVVIRHI